MGFNCVATCFTGDTDASHLCSFSKLATAYTGYSLADPLVVCLIAGSIVLVFGLGYRLGAATKKAVGHQVVTVHVGCSRFSSQPAASSSHRQALLDTPPRREMLVRSDSNWSGGSWDVDNFTA